MSIDALRLLPLCLGALMLASCSKQQADPPAVPPTVAKAPAKARPNACDLVTAAEMSTILGGPVVAAAGGNEYPPRKTECIYSPAQENGPYAELEVDWDDGDPQVLEMVAGVAGGTAKGMVTEFEGLGELAWRVTSFQVFVSTRGHLMMIRFMPGATEVAARARRIHETALPRL